MAKYSFERVTRGDIHCYHIYRDKEHIETVYDRCEAQEIVDRYNNIKAQKV